jgi:hypothetical protein
MGAESLIDSTASMRRTDMPILEINPIRQISASIRLDETTAAQVDQYAAFIHASADDVVDKALNYVFSKDCDFQEFLKSAGTATPSLRVRRPAQPNGQQKQKPRPNHQTGA